MRQLIIRSIFFAALLLPVFSFAGIDECSPNDVHCAYLTGSNTKDGKFIKLIELKYNTSVVLCASADMAATVTQDMIQSGIYKNGDFVRNVYLQCKNASCIENALLAIDEFTIIKNSDKYSSIPQTFAVGMLDGYGDDCHPDFPAKKIRALNIRKS